MKSFFKFRKSSTDLSDWGRQDDKLLAAVEAKNLEKVDQLLTKKGISATKLHSQGFTIFHRAATQGTLEVVNLLLAHRANTNAIDANGRTALHCAARNGHAHVVEKLVQVNNNAFAGDHSELTALHHACLGGSLDAAKVLLQYDAPLSFVDKDGRTPLFIAAQMEHPSICKELLDKGADVNAVDHHGRTALMLAAEHGNKTVCEYLTKKGGDPFLSDDRGHTAWWYAEQNGHPEILRVLEQGPIRAAWNQGKEDTLHLSVTPPQDNPIGEFCANQRMPQQTKLGNGVDDPFEHGIIPFDQYQEVETFILDDGHTLSEVSSIVTASAPQSSIRPGTSVSSHHHNHSNSQRELHTHHEAYKELEEEHDMLSIEMERVAMENSRLQDRVHHLEKRLEAILDPGDESRHSHADLVVSSRKQVSAHLYKDGTEQSSVDDVMIESMEEEMKELQNLLDAERNQNLALEDQIRQLRKQLDTSSKPEAEQDGDEDSWNDSDGEDLFEIPGKRKASSSEEDSKTIAVLRGQLLVLTKENEELLQAMEAGNIQSSALTDRLQAEEEVLDLACSSASDTLGLLQDVAILRKEKQDLTDQMEAIETECNEVQSKNRSLEQQLEEAEEACVRMRTELHEQVRSSHHLPDRMSATEREELREGRAHLERELQKLKMSIKTIKNNATGAVSSRDDEAQDTFEELVSQQVELKEQYEKVVLENEERKVQNEQLSMDIVEIHAQVQELEQLAEFSDSLQEENNRLKEKLEKYKALEITTSGSSANHDALALLNAEMQEENKDLKSENRTLLGQLKEIQKSMEDSLASKQQQSKHVEEASCMGKVAELRAELIHMKDKIKRQEQTIQKLREQEEENVKLRQDYDSLLLESEKFQDSIEELQDLLKQQTEELSSEKEAVHQRNLELEQENTLLLKQLDMRNRQMNEQNNGATQKKNHGSKIPVRDKKQLRGNVTGSLEESKKGDGRMAGCDIAEQEQGLWDEVLGSDKKLEDLPGDLRSLEGVDQRIIDLQRQVARLQRQLAEADCQHREIISTYRTHLLTAVQGRMDPEVLKALEHIIRLRSTEQFC